MLSKIEVDREHAAHRIFIHAVDNCDQAPPSTYAKVVFATPLFTYLDGYAAACAFCLG